MPHKRSSVIRDRFRAMAKRSKPACHICGQSISYDLPHTDPKSFVADHVIALDRGGADALSNLAAAHRRQPRLQLHEESPRVRSHRSTKRQLELASAGEQVTSGISIRQLDLTHQ